MKSAERIRHSNYTIMGIDGSSKHIAIAICKRDGEKRNLLYAGKINFEMADVNDKMKIIAAVMPEIIQTYNVDHVVIEQTIYVQNAKTFRILSYIVGAVWQAAIKDCNVEDVAPMTWKNYLGYQRFTAKDKAALNKKMGKLEAKKFMAFERKERVKRLLKLKIPLVDEIDDHDIVDAIGIAVWAMENVK